VDYNQLVTRDDWLKESRCRQEPAKTSTSTYTQAPAAPVKPPPVTYEKGIQTALIPDKDKTHDDHMTNEDGDIVAKTAIATEAEIRARIMKEIEMQKEIDRMEEEERRREQENARNRGLDPSDLQSIYASDDFQSFLDHSTKVVERALNDQYDYLRDYTIGDGDDGL
jgi:dynein intermediate chain